MTDTINITLSDGTTLDDFVTATRDTIASLTKQVEALSGMASSVTAIQLGLASTDSTMAANQEADAAALAGLQEAVKAWAASKASGTTTGTGSTTATGSSATGTGTATSSTGTGTTTTTGTTPTQTGSGGGSTTSQPTTLTSNADFSITACTITGTPGSQSLWVHGGWVADMPAAYDYTLDGGATWTAAGGFANDGGAFDSWVYNLTVAPGSYTVAIRDHANPSHIAVAPNNPIVVLPNTAPASVTFTPIAFSTSLPTGTQIGTIEASGGTPQYPLKITAATTNSAAYAITPVVGNAAQWTVSIADQTKLVAGAQTLAGSIASGTVSAPFSFDFTIAAGVVVPASALTLTQAVGLTNATPVGTEAFTLAIAGYTGGTFAISAQQGMADLPTNMAARYTLSGATGTTSNTLSAQTETITVVWTDGVNTCVAPLTLTIADVRGTGPKVSFDPTTIATVMHGVSTPPVAGAVCTAAPGTYTAGWITDSSDGWDGNALMAPQTFMAAPGVMPMFTQPGAWIPNGKGWLETFGWDAEFTGLQFSQLAQDNPGEVLSFSGIKLNAGLMGSTQIKYCLFDLCTNGVQGGDYGQVVTISYSEFAKCGGSNGFTHNFYLAAISEAIVDHVVSWGANVGHCGKIRAAVSSVTNSVFADGPNGCASYLLDIPDGGAAVVQNVIFDKGPNAQNSPMLRYGEECQNTHPVNTLLVDTCQFINRAASPPRLPNGDVIQPVGIEVGLASGAPVTLTFKNCTFYGLPEVASPSFGPQAVRSDGPNVTVIDGGGNQYLSLSAAPDASTYMSLTPADANPIKHPWQVGGYASAMTVYAGYLEGPMAGK